MSWVRRFWMSLDCKTVNDWLKEVKAADMNTIVDFVRHCG